MNDREDRVLHYESELERALAYLLLTDRDVVLVREQYPVVTYVDDEGRVRTHTFDFFVVLRSGVRVAFAVKPKHRVAKSGLRRLLELVAAQTGAEHADHFEVRTQEHLPRARVENAVQVYDARRVRDEDDVAALSAVVARQRGKVRVSDLLAALPERNGLLSAVLNLLDDGLLELANDNRRLDLSSFVLPAEAA